MNQGIRLSGTVALAVVLSGAAGACVPEARYQAALAEAQRARTEAWQRNLELSAARWMAERLAQENAALRAQAQGPAGMQALAARVDEIARRQDRMDQDLRRAIEASRPAPQPAPSTQPTTKPRDPLHTRF